MRKWLGIIGVLVFTVIVLALALAPPLALAATDTDTLGTSSTLPTSMAALLPIGLFIGGLVGSLTTRRRDKPRKETGHVANLNLDNGKHTGHMASFTNGKESPTKFI